jgi:hypothetical protein
VTDGGRCQRRGSRSAPQSAHPAANGVTRSPHRGQYPGCVVHGCRPWVWRAV